MLIVLLKCICTNTNFLSISYFSFTRSTRESVRNFIASRVESLKKETGGVVEDSDQAPIINDSYQKMEIAMLNFIFNPSAQNGSVNLSLFVYISRTQYSINCV